MPREQITREPLVEGYIPTILDGLPTVHPVSEGNSAVSLLHVGWNRDAGWVQVSLEVPPYVAKMYVEDEPNAERIPFYTEPLSRAEINKLIRVLKRARDAAYGKDE